MIDISLMMHSFPLLLKGASTSLMLAASACVIGLVWGTVLGLCYLDSSKWTRFFVGTYIFVFRGTPMLIQIMFFFYVLPQIGMQLPGFWCAVLAIGLNSAAYISQTVKSGINSLCIGQLEAAKTLGMSPWQTKRYVILPQVYRVIFPSIGNEMITLIKDSSLASIIGVMELSKEGSIIRAQTYDAFTILLAVACIYLLMTTALSCLLKVAQNKVGKYAQV